MESAQGAAAVDALAGNVDTLFDGLLSTFEHLNAEGGVGQYDVFLCRQSSVLEHAVEDLCRLFLCGTADEFLRFGNVETEVAG